MMIFKVGGPNTLEVLTAKNSTGTGGSGQCTYVASSALPPLDTSSVPYQASADLSGEDSYSMRTFAITSIGSLGLEVRWNPKAAQCPFYDVVELSMAWNPANIQAAGEGPPSRQWRYEVFLGLDVSPEKGSGELAAMQQTLSVGWPGYGPS